MAASFYRKAIEQNLSGAQFALGTLIAVCLFNHLGPHDITYLFQVQCMKMGKAWRRI